jgi:hypothetical protein
MAVATLDETVRYCGKNQVLMELLYNGVNRLVEVYSYRVSKAGDTLLCAYCLKDDRSERFRVDRIEHAKATETKFSPRWPVEVT